MSSCEQDGRYWWFIRRFYVAFAGADRMRWRKLVLRMYWDGQKTPAVEVPLGDFFGAVIGNPPILSIFGR